MKGSLQMPAHLHTFSTRTKANVMDASRMLALTFAGKRQCDLDLDDDKVDEEV